MKHILLFLCALLFALTGNTAPACNEPEQLLAEARTATNAAGSVFSGELERAMTEARRAMEATGREIERAVAEARRLTPREREVMELLAQGKSLSGVAHELIIAEGTAKAHTRHIYEKLGINTRQELLDLLMTEQ